MRNAARQQIYEEFSERIGDIITGTVLQITNEFTIVKIREGVEAELPYFDLRRHPEERNELLRANVILTISVLRPLLLMCATRIAMHSPFAVSICVLQS